MKRKWNVMSETKDRKVAKDLKAVAYKLESICRKYGLGYAEVYLIQTDNSATLNVRGKKKIGDTELVNLYSVINPTSKVEGKNEESNSEERKQVEDKE